MKLISRTVGHGPHLVLLHGWGLNSGVWQPLIEKIQSVFTVTTIDLPGFGLNHNAMPALYDLPTVAQLVAQHIPAQSIVLGWSLGGLVAQQIALSAPEKINQLILVATSPKFTEDADWPGINRKVLANFKTQLDSDLSNTISRFLAIQAMGSPTAKQDVKAIKLQVDAYPQANPVALSAGLNILEQSDFRTQLSQFNCPIHFLLGRLDSLVPIKIVEAMQNLNANLDFTVFAHSSHAPFMSEAERFAAYLLDL